MRVTVVTFDLPFQSSSRMLSLPFKWQIHVHYYRVKRFNSRETKLKRGQLHLRTPDKYILRYVSFQARSVYGNIYIIQIDNKKFTNWKLYAVSYVNYFLSKYFFFFSVKKREAFSWNYTAKGTSTSSAVCQKNTGTLYYVIHFIFISTCTVRCNDIVLQWVHLYEFL